MVSHCGFYLYSLMPNDSEHFFHVLIGSSYIFLSVYKVFCPFFIWIVLLLLSHSSSLCILNTDSLPDLCFMNICY